MIFISVTVMPDTKYALDAEGKETPSSQYFFQLEIKRNLQFGNNMTSGFLSMSNIVQR